MLALQEKCDVVTQLPVIELSLENECGVIPSAFNVCTPSDGEDVSGLRSLTRYNANDDCDKQGTLVTTITQGTLVTTITQLSK